MALSNSEKRRLRSRANTLKSTINVGREGATEQTLDMLRLAFRKTDLIKVRIHGTDGPESDAIAQSIAVGTPCELVARTGHVAVFSRPAEAGDESM